MLVPILRLAPIYFANTCMELRIWKQGWAHQYIVSCDQHALLDSLRILYAEDNQLEIPNLECKTITVAPQGEQYQVCFNTHTMSTDSPVQAICNFLFQDVNFLPSLFPLHGGAIAVGNQAQIFLASTRTGKTTLTAYLANKGYSYLNDDHVLIEMDTLSVIPNCSPLHLRPESIPILEQYGCAIQGTVVQTGKNLRIIYSPENTVKKPLQIGNIFILERNATDNSYERLSVVEAVQVLLAHSLSPATNDMKRLQCAIQLANRYQCIRLRYADLNFISNVMERWVRPSTESNDLLFLRAKVPYSFEIIVHGTSMQPILHDGDTITLCRKDEYVPGDILVFAYNYGAILVHRLLKIENGRYICKGDNAFRLESVKPEQIAGAVILDNDPHRNSAFLEASLKINHIFHRCRFDKELTRKTKEYQAYYQTYLEEV